MSGRKLAKKAGFGKPRRPHPLAKGRFSEVMHHRNRHVALVRPAGASTWEFAYCPMSHPRPTFPTLTAAVTYCVVEGWI